MRAIARVSASGGRPELVTTVASGKESAHLWPRLLPGRTLSFTVTDSAGASQVVVQSLATGERRLLLPGAIRAPFDGTRATLTGRPSDIVDQLGFGIVDPFPMFDVSNDGTLVHIEGARLDQRLLTWVDRQGRPPRCGRVRRGMRPLRSVRTTGARRERLSPVPGP